MTWDVQIVGALCSECREELPPREVKYEHLAEGSFQSGEEWPILANARRLHGRTFTHLRLREMEDCGQALLTLEARDG